MFCARPPPSALLPATFLLMSFLSSSSLTWIRVSCIPLTYPNILPLCYFLLSCPAPRETLSVDHTYIHPSVDESQAGSTLPVTDKDAVVESLILFNLVSMTRIQISFLVQCMFQFSTLHLNYEILQKPFKKALVHSGTEFSSTVWSRGDTEDSWCFLICFFTLYRGLQSVKSTRQKLTALAGGILTDLSPGS